MTQGVFLGTLSDQNGYAMSVYLVLSFPFPRFASFLFALTTDDGAGRVPGGAGPTPKPCPE